MPRVLITGASSAIGRELLARLGEAGAELIGHCHAGADKLEALRAAHPQLQGLTVVPADLRVEAQADGLVERVAQLWGAPDQIVHLPAARLRLGRVLEWRWEDLQADLELQTRSVLRLLRAFLPAMSKAPCPTKVVFMLSSVTLGVPPKFLSAYTVAKYAQWGLMRCLAAEYGHTQVRINAVSPSTIDTPFLSEVPRKWFDLAASQNPRGRNATVQDVVPAILFLLSPAADYLNGVNLPLTAGAQS